MERIEERIAEFYQTQDEAVYHEIAQLLKTEETLWAAVCPTSRNYYVNRENNAHSAYVFTNKSYFEDFQDYMQKQGIVLEAVQNEQKHRIMMLTDLYRSGFSMVLVNNGHHQIGIYLRDIAENSAALSHDDPAAKLVTNPSFVRAANYFYQSLHCGKPDRNCQIAMFRELYDAKFIMPVAVHEENIKGNQAQIRPGEEIGYPMVTNPEKTEQYFPFFSDFHELRRFDPEHKFRSITVGFRELCRFAGSANGIVINPIGCNLRMDPELLQAVEQVVDGSISMSAPKKETASIRFRDPESIPSGITEGIAAAVKDNSAVKAVYIKLVSKNDTTRPNYMIILDGTKASNALCEAIAGAVMPHTEGLNVEFADTASPVIQKAIASAKPVYKRRRFGIF